MNCWAEKKKWNKNGKFNWKAEKLDILWLAIFGIQSKIVEHLHLRENGDNFFLFLQLKC